MSFLTVKALVPVKYSVMCVSFESVGNAIIHAFPPWPCDLLIES